MADKVEIEILAKDGASGVISGVTGALGRMFETAGGFILHDVFSSIARGAKELAVELFGLGKDSILAAARVDELRAVNEVLAKNAGLSLDAVRAEAAEVKSMGIEAAVSERVVAEFIRAQLDLSKASDIARIAQDAAVLSGKNSSEATDAIIQGIVKLNPLMLRNAGITVDLQASYEAMAEELGITTADLTTAQKQQAAMNAVMEAGSGIAGAYEAAMREPGKILRSFPRYFDDIKVAIGEPFQEAFASALIPIADLAKWFGTAVSEGGALRPVLDGVAAKIQEFADAFGNMIGAFIESGGDWKVLFTTFEDGSSYISGMLESLGLSKDKATGIADAINQLVTGGGLSGLFEQLLPEGTTGAFTGFMDTLGQIGAALAPLLPLFGGFGSILFQSLLPAFVQISEMLGPVIEEIFPLLISTLAEVGTEVVENLLPPFIDFVEQVLPPLLDLLTPLIELFGSLMITLAPLVGEILGFLAELLLQVVAAIAPLVEMLLPILAQLFSTVIEAILPLLAIILPPLISIVLMLIESFMPLIVAVLPLVASLIEVVIKAVAPLLEALLPLFVQLVEFLVAAFEPMLNVTMPILIGFLESLTSWINTQIVPALQTFQDWIDNKVTPAIEGISGALDTAIGWLGDLASGLGNISLPDWLTPGSPTPFEMGLRGISSAMKELNTSALPGFGSGLAISGAGSGVFSSSPALAGAGAGGGSYVMQVNSPIAIVDHKYALETVLPLLRDAIRELKREGTL